MYCMKSFAPTRAIAARGFGPSSFALCHNPVTLPTYYLLMAKSRLCGWMTCGSALSFSPGDPFPGVPTVRF